MAEGTASFPVTIGLTAANKDDLANAARAVRAEYRATTRWKRLRCHNVTLLDDDTDTGIYVLDVGGAVEFDWTWEGAFAFRPSYGAEFGDSSDLDRMLDEYEGRYAENSDIYWFGEVVEVNETDGLIYVSAPESEQPPTRGWFYVCPFEFLQALESIYNKPGFASVRERLPGRLVAARGSQHPPVVGAPIASLSDLSGVWSHAWGYIWGPPGTGKTYTLGKQIATCLADPAERLLVVSTTNKATDEAALAIGYHATESTVANGRALRIGKNADYDYFEQNGLEVMLENAEADLLRRVVQLRAAIKRSRNEAERAKLRQELQLLSRALKDRALEIFLSKATQVVISTAFKAVSLLRDPTLQRIVEADQAPFTTIFIDEAGLLSRAMTATLSLLASRRVVLVGDPKQLAPISKMSRVLPTNQRIWLASSGLSHLASAHSLHSATHLLTKQYRMHPDIRQVVSEYQYGGMLIDAEKVVRPGLGWKDHSGNEVPRAIWYVLDEEGEDLPALRAERGPANRSWVRQLTIPVLEKLLSDPALREKEGLFLSPFAAQAKAIRGYFQDQELENWWASTVHSQQGAEAEVVIFDTVNASSTAWPHDEWKRLINVGMSRAKLQLILLASRAEMRQPFLSPLLRFLPAFKVLRHRSGIRFEHVEAVKVYQAPADLMEIPELVGNQISLRRSLRPVLSSDQQRLSKLRMDGKPRLVRGVAGSGKTVVLANWLSQVVKNLGQEDDVIWVVYANNALKGMIASTIQSVWEDERGGVAFPWEKVQMLHVLDILKMLGDELWLTKHVKFAGDGYDFDGTSSFYLKHVSFEEIAPRCDAMFVDEAQDMGANTLRLLSGLVRRTDSLDANSRAVNIFYDNAQNVYGRPTPKWSDMGLDMRGRSTVLKESFRSTRPIMEYALNVLYRLQPPDGDEDHRELVERELIERINQNGRDWWKVRFAEAGGPAPMFQSYSTKTLVIDAIAEQIMR